MAKLKLEASKSEASKSETSRSEASKSETSKSETSKSEASRSEASDVEIYRRKAIAYSQEATKASSAQAREQYARLALSSLAIAKNAEWRASLDAFIGEMRRGARV